VEHFDCGNTSWATTINQWIRSEEALKRVRKKSTKIWLYHNQASELIGYGSLGVTKWSIFSDEPKKPVLILPNLGVQKGHQRQGFGREICMHLIEESQKLYFEGKSQGKTLLPFLGLVVHPDNTDAIGLYKSAGFNTYDHYVEDDGVRYIGMAKLLDHD